MITGQGRHETGGKGHLIPNRRQVVRLLVIQHKEGPIAFSKMRPLRKHQLGQYRFGNAHLCGVLELDYRALIDVEVSNNRVGNKWEHRVGER